MADSRTFVVVGAGLAGAKTVEALREQGFGGRLLLVGEEPVRPYERPPLSKEFMLHKKPIEYAFVHEAGWYDEHDVELRTGVRADALDLAAHTVALSDGTTATYDKLLLATGSTARHLPIPGSDAAGVLTLRRMDDAQRLDEAITAGGPLVVIGAGWIGLEAAAAARQRGVDVTVLETAELPLLRVLGTEVATLFADLHVRHGVDLRLSVGGVDAVVTADGRATGVRLTDGTTFDAGAVLIGVGAAPEVSLATAAGLDVDGGVLVDASLRTSDPDVLAAGDIAAQDHPTLPGRIRVEHWATALKMPATAAAVMLGGDDVYDELPYFYTDQYDLGMEYVGYVEPGAYDRVVFRGDPATGAYLAFWTAGGRVLAGMNVNVWDVVDDVKALVRAGTPVDPARLADPSVPLAELA